MESVTLNKKSTKDLMQGKLNLLPAYVEFILNHKLEDFIREQIHLSRKVEAPIMKFFDHIPEDQLVQMSIEPTKEFWTYLVNGDVENQMKDAIEKWKNNQLKIINSDQVAAEDITKGNYVRKVCLLKFIPDYNPDYKVWQALNAEIDYYLQVVSAESFKAFVDVQNERLEGINRNLVKNEEQLLEAQALANMGSFEWDLTDGHHSFFTPQLFKIFGMEKASTLSEFFKDVHPDDRDKLNAAIEAAVKGNGEYECEYRYLRNGVEKFIWSRGRVKYENDKPVYLNGTVMDVTERYLFMRQLQERDELYREAQEATHLGNWSWDIVTNKITWSDEMYRLYGLAPQSEEITFDRFVSLIHPDDREKRVKDIEESIATGQTSDYKIRVITPAGDIKVLKGNSKVVVSKSGTATRMLGTCQDITAEHNLQKKLEDEYLFTTTLLDNSVDFITAYDDALNLIAINKTTEERFGVKREDVIGKPAVEVFPKLMESEVLDYLKRGLKGELQYYPESKSPVTEHFYERHIIPLYNANGKVYAVLSIGHDITELKKINIEISNLNKNLEQKNELLRLSEERHQKMVAEIQDYAILLMDKNGIILNWNLGAERIKGYSASEIVGHSFEAFYGAMDKDSGLPKQLLAEATKHGRATHEGWRVRKDGTPFWGNTVITALHNSENELIGFSKITRDLSERKLAEERLQESNILLQQLNHSLEIKNQLLERSNKELSAFSYVASHDLQEPLRKIKTFANMISEKDGEQLIQRHRELLERIIVASNNMQRLIEDLLAYSRAHNDPDQFEEVDLNELLENYKSELAASEKGVDVTIKAGKLPKISGIKFQLNQLLDNLIGNSVKYAKEGLKPEITINTGFKKGKELELHGADNQKSYYVMEFADNGIGFEQKYADRIFQPFQRLHGKNEYSGTGIGLAICKKIVQNHGGVIYAESKPGEGSSFFVAIPTTSNQA